MTKFGCHVIVLAYFWYFKLIFIFRGPIYGLFELFTNIWQPWKSKSDLILLLRKLKNPWIWILFFRVAKIWQSGLPYLWRIWRYNFKIDVRWWAKHQLKWPCIQILWGNFSRIVPTARPPVKASPPISLPAPYSIQACVRAKCTSQVQGWFVG